MKGNEKKNKELKKTKSDVTSTKVQSEYQKDKTRKTIVEPSVPKPKK